MAEKDEPEGEAKTTPAPADAPNAHCTSCGTDFFTDKDFAAKEPGSRPRCKCQKYTVITMAKWKEQKAEEDAEKARKDAGVVYGNAVEESKILAGILEAYGVAKEKVKTILMNYEIPEYHEARGFFHMLTELHLPAAQAEHVTRAFFHKITRGSAPSGVLPMGSTPAFSIGPPGNPFGQQAPGSFPGGGAPMMTPADVERIVAERVAKEREADRAKAMEERLRKQDEEIAKLKAGEGVAKSATPAGAASGKVRVIKQPVYDPATGEFARDKTTGTLVYTFIEEPIEQESSEERLVRLLKEQGIVGQRTEPETPKWVDRLEGAIKANKPPEVPRPSAEMEAKVDKERQLREDAEKQARADREKLQRELDTARAEKVAAEHARQVDQQIQPIKDRMAAAEREAAALRDRPPGTDPHLARMQGEQGLLEKSSQITFATVDKTVALLASSPFGQAMAAQQRMEISMKAAQFAKQNDMDPEKFTHDILAGPLATAPTPSERGDLTEKMKKAAEGKGA